MNEQDYAENLRVFREKFDMSPEEMEKLFPNSKIKKEEVKEDE